MVTLRSVIKNIDKLQLASALKYCDYLGIFLTRDVDNKSNAWLISEDDGVKLLDFIKSNTKEDIEQIIRKHTLIKKHGSIDNWKKDMVARIKETKKERYGSENYNNKDKYEATSLERYGQTNIFKTEKFKEYLQDRNLELYGVKYYT